ncbi:MAG: hypothetical protein WC955_10620 [Elusimicrobiota bacterium]
MAKNNVRLKSDIKAEIKLIEQVVEYLVSMKNKTGLNSLNDTQKAAIGTYLMNFYNGIENILKRISKEYYKTMPKGESWHKELLELSASPSEGKVAVLNAEIVKGLNPYRGFRHFFVSGYGFKLDVELLAPLITNIEPLWNEIKKALSKFIESI